MTDPHRVDDVTTLRALYGEPGPIASAKVWDTIDPSAAAFIAASPLALLATADARGNVDVSPKGDAPGFVAVEDARTLLVPDRRGNKLVFGLQNVVENPHVGLIFLVPGTPETLRVNGRAELTRDPALCEHLAARGAAALLVIRVTVEECFFHCPKAFLRAGLWKPETWRPHRVSFGAIFAPKLGGDAALAAQIDEALAIDARDNL